MAPGKHPGWSQGPGIFRGPADHVPSAAPWAWPVPEGTVALCPLSSEPIQAGGRGDQSATVSTHGQRFSSVSQGGWAVQSLGSSGDAGLAVVHVGLSVGRRVHALVAGSEPFPALRVWCLGLAALPLSPLL